MVKKSIVLQLISMVTFNSVSIGNKAYLIIVTWNCTIFVAFIKQVSNLIDPPQPPPPTHSSNLSILFCGWWTSKNVIAFINEQKKGKWCENNVISWKKRHIFKWNMVLWIWFIFLYSIMPYSLFMFFALFVVWWKGMNT